MLKSLVALCSLLALLSLTPTPADALLQKGEAFPDVAGETLSGEPFHFSSLRGQPVLVKIGTTWCGTCNLQSKAIDKIHDYLAEQGVTVVEVFIQESATKVRKYFAEKGFALPDQVVLDDGAISRQLNVYVIPRLLLLDAENRVYRDGDPLSSQALQQQIEQMLAKH